MRAGVKENESITIARLWAIEVLRFKIK